MSYNLHTVKANASGAIVSEYSDVVINVVTDEINASLLTSAQKITAINALIAAPLENSPKYYKGVSALIDRIYTDIDTIFLPEVDGVSGATSINISAPSGTTITGEDLTFVNGNNIAVATVGTSVAIHFVGDWLDRINALSGSVATNSINITTLNTRMDALSGTVLTNTANISTNTSSINTINTNISILNSVLAVTTGNVSSNTANISTISGQVITLNAALVVATGNIATNLTTLNNHIADTNNPHIVTASQVNLGNVQNLPLSGFAGNTFINTVGTITGGIWNGTSISSGFISQAYWWNISSLNVEVVSGSLNSHISNVSNPHSVTATQVGKDTAQWNADRLKSEIIIDTNKAEGRTLIYRSASSGLVYETISGVSGAVTPLADMHIFVGNTAGAATDVPMSAICLVGTITGGIWNGTAITNAYIGTDAITSGKILDKSIIFAKMPDIDERTFIGRNGGSGSPTMLSSGTVRTMLEINLVENTALSTWAGSSNITTIGVIGGNIISSGRITCSSNIISSGNITGLNLSGTNTGDQSLFSTIAVAGEPNIVADSTSDTLTLVPSGIIQIYQNAGTDTITIFAPTSTGGGLTYTEVASTGQTMATDTIYIANTATLLSFTLPDTAAVGKAVGIIGKGAGGWRLKQNASEIIHFGSVDTTTGTGGRIDSLNRRDVIYLVCTVANTEWTVVQSIGTMTIV